MPLPDFLQTATFRLAATFAIAFAISAALLFAFIYWEVALYETQRVDGFMTRDAGFLAGQTPRAIDSAVALRILGDLHRITYAAVFDRAGRRRIGNLDSLPVGLPIDGRAHAVEASQTEGAGDQIGTLRAVARRLPDGDILVIGRNVDELERLGALVRRALLLGVVPAMALAIAAGAFVSWRAQQRVKAVHLSAQRIMVGDLRERLPTGGTRDDFDRLARSVNLMLDEIARLLDTVKEAGDDIAHDLRTPLARLRTRLERSKEAGHSLDDLRQIVDSAVSDLDQALGLITTLLRIGEIESAPRHRRFEAFDLGALAEEIGQIYQPLAEDRDIHLEIASEAGLAVAGDRGLIMEAIANLLQNAIKFTQPGGRVELAALATSDGPAVRVTDNGPGIPPGERDRVFDRFYQLDKSRHADGSGLGLSLVAAVVKRHGFRITLTDADPGCIFELTCRARPDPARLEASRAAAG